MAFWVLCRLAVGWRVAINVYNVFSVHEKFLEELKSAFQFKFTTGIQEGVWSLCRQKKSDEISNLQGQLLSPEWKEKQNETKKHKKKRKKEAENQSKTLVCLQGLGLWRVVVQASSCPVGPLVVPTAWL